MVRPTTILGLATLLLVGCDRSTLVQVVRPVVVDPTASSFPLEGKWQPLEDPVFGDSPSGSPYLVRRLEGGSYEVASEGEPYKVVCKVVSLDEDHSQALLECRLVGEGASDATYLAIAAIEAHRLYYSLAINTKKLAECMADEGYSAVIEHGVWCSTVTADGNDLLNCVRKHAKELVGPPSTLTRCVRVDD